METTGRKARFKNGTYTGGGRAIKSKLDVLASIYEMDMVRSTILRNLHPKRGTGFAISIERLHELDLVRKVIGPNALHTPDVLELSPYGERFLYEHQTLPPRYLRTHVPRGTGERLQFHHSLMLSDLIGNIRTGVNTHNLSMVPLGAAEERIGKTDDAPLSVPVDITYDHPKSGVSKFNGNVKPDGLFGLTYPNQQTSFFVVEVQHKCSTRRSMVDGVSMVRKLLGYQHIYEKGLAKEHWQLPNFRVLFAFAFVEDYDQSIRLAEELFGKTNLFLFKHLPIHHETPSGYLVAPKPRPELITDDWSRAGMEPTALYTPGK